MNNIGKLNEDLIVKYINEKRFLEYMNNNIKNFLRDVFEFDVSRCEFYAKKFFNNYKPDIVIIANGVKKYISIKSGKNNSVHQEHICSFNNFLESIYVDKKAIKYLKEFHYNDGTIDGTGFIRKSAEDFLKFTIKVNFVNKELSNYKKAKQIINRVLFKGEYPSIPQVDYMYYGNISTGVWASKEQIVNFLLKNKFNSNRIHISSLYYQSLDRNVRKDLIYEFKRNHVQIKWYSLKEDISFIHCKKRQIKKPGNELF